MMKFILQSQQLVMPGFKRIRIDITVPTDAFSGRSLPAAVWVQMPRPPHPSPTALWFPRVARLAVGLEFSESRSWGSAEFFV